MSRPIRIQRPTVSFIIRLDDFYKVLLIKFRPPKRQGKIGIPGGGRGMTDTILRTAVKEGNEELGLGEFLTQNPADWVTLAIRDSPDRDDVHGKPLSKYVDGDNIPDVTVDARHNLDFLLVYLPAFKGNPAELVPADPKEVEQIQVVDVQTLRGRETLAISDDFESLDLYRRWVSGSVKHTPVYM